MGKHFREAFNMDLEPKTTPDMRIFCQRPGRQDKDGNPIYFTEQAHKNQCDVNHIIQKYDKTGLINHISRIEAKFGDLTGDDYKTMADRVINAQNMFNDLPAEIRKRFENSPENLLRFMDDPNNRNEAIQLGLIHENWTPDSDGLGEHIQSPDQRKKIDPDQPKIKNPGPPKHDEF
jgi:phage internal scaffolding protein